MTLSDVRKHLLAVRKEKGYTQEEVAEDADVSQPTVSRLEDWGKPMEEIEFESVRKIIEQGLQMTLSTFFLQIERRTNSDLRSPGNPAHTSPGTTTDRARGGGDDGSHLDVSSAPAKSELVEFFDELADLAGAASARLATGSGANRKNQPRRAGRPRKTTHKKTGSA